MARGIEGNEVGTAKKKAPPSTQKSSSGKQQSIAGFFQKRTGPAAPKTVTPAKRPSEPNGADSTSKATRSSPDLPVSAGAAPSSSSPPAPTHSSPQNSIDAGKNKENGMKTRDQSLHKHELTC